MHSNVPALLAELRSKPVQVTDNIHYAPSGTVRARYINAAEVERASRLQLAKAEPTILFDDRYDFEFGGMSFVCLSMPGETYDRLAVWLHSQKQRL